MLVAGHGWRSRHRQATRSPWASPGRSRTLASASTAPVSGPSTPTCTQAAGARHGHGTLAPSIPLGRPGTAHEAATAILWLLSPAASYVTGAVLDVSGGGERHGRAPGGPGWSGPPVTSPCAAEEREDAMEVTLLGTSTPYPRPDDPGSSLLVRGEGTRLWLDAGSGTLGALLALPAGRARGGPDQPHPRGPLLDPGRDLLRFALRRHPPPLAAGAGPVGRVQRPGAFLNHAGLASPPEAVFETHEIGVPWKEGPAVWAGGHPTRSLQRSRQPPGHHRPSPEPKRGGRLPTLFRPRPGRRQRSPSTTCSSAWAPSPSSSAPRRRQHLGHLRPPTATSVRSLAEIVGSLSLLPPPRRGRLGG